MKFFKKCKFIAMLSLCGVMMFSNTYAGLFGKGGSSALGKILKILQTMQKTQLGIQTKEIEIAIKQAQQYEVEYNTLQAEYQNLKSLSEGIKGRDIDSLNQMIDQIKNDKSMAERILKENMTQLENISKWFSIHQDEFKQGTKTEQQVYNETKERLEKMRNDVQETNLKLRQKNDKGYSLRTEDLEKLKTKLNTVNNTTGQLEALQALGALQAENTAVLIDIKEILKDQSTLISNNQIAEITNKQANEQAKKDEEEANEKTIKKIKEQAQKDSNKSIKIKFD